MTKIDGLMYGAVAQLPPAAWDLKSFLENAKSYVQTVGGVLLMLLGAAGLVWGGVLLVKKLMGNQQQSHQHGWGQIIMLVLVGGALGTGGWQLISTVGSGGQTTIEDLGGGGGNSTIDELGGGTIIIIQPFARASRSGPAAGVP